MSARVAVALLSCSEERRCVLGGLVFVFGVSLLMSLLLRWLLLVGSSSAEPVSDGEGEVYSLRDEGAFGGVFPGFGTVFGKRLWAVRHRVAISIERGGVRKVVEASSSCGRRVGFFQKGARWW